MNVHLSTVLTGHLSGIYTLCLSPDEDGCFYAGGGEGWISLWDPGHSEQGKIVAKAETQVFSLAIDNHILAAGNMSGGIHWLNILEKSDFKNILHHKKGVFNLQIVNDFLYSIGGDGCFTKWDKTSATPLETIKLSDKPLRCAVYHQTKNLWAIGASDGNIYFVNNADFTYTDCIESAHDNSVFSLAFSQKDYLFSGGRDALLKVWKLDPSPTLSQSINAHWFTINDLQISPNGKFLISASRDKSIKIWDTQTLELLKVLDRFKNIGGHTHSVNRLLWLDNETFVSGGDDKKIAVWKVQYSTLTNANLSESEIPPGLSPGLPSGIG